MLHKNLKGEWFDLYGLDISEPYGINESTVEIYGFFSPTNYEGQMIRDRMKDFLTEKGK